MKSLTNGLESGLHVVNLVLHHISNATLFLVTFLITFGVIGRFFFGQPITGAYELTEQGSAILVFFTLAIAHQYHEHVSVGFIVDKLPLKARCIVEGIIEWFVFIVIIFMSWYMIQDGIRTMGRNITTSDLGLPVHPFIMIAAIGGFAFALTALVKGMQHFIRAVEQT